MDLSQTTESYEKMINNTRFLQTSGELTKLNYSDTKSEIYSSELFKTGQTHKKFKVNMIFLIAFSIFINLGGIQIGYILSSANQMDETFNVIFNWQDKKEKALYQSLIGASVVGGMALGAITAGRFVSKGRRLSFIFSSIIGIVGCGITMVSNINAILIGRVIYGYGVGVLSVNISRYIEETIPEFLLSYFAPIYPWAQTAGGLLVLFMAIGLPDDGDKEGLRASWYWRFIFGFPIILFIISILGMLFVIKYDSPKFLINKNDTQNAKSMIRQVYSKSQSFEQIMSYVGYTTQKETSKVTYWQALTHPDYRVSTWIVIGLVIFHELSGSNAIILYSNRMLQEMSHEDASFTPREGTYYIGISSCVSAGIAVVFIKIFKRRSLLYCGHILMAICHFMIGIFEIKDNDLGVLVMMAIFLAVYQIANGTVFWIYSSEIAVDAALGICMLFLWGTVLVLSLTVNFLMDSSLQPHGVFFLFGGISLLGAVFCFLFIKETSDLNDKEKKQLYKPKKFQDVQQ